VSTGFVVVPRAGALRAARMETPLHGTSIDHKITQRLGSKPPGKASDPATSRGGKAGRGKAANGSAAAPPAAGAKRPRAVQVEDSDDSNAFEDEEDGEDDAPLPGAAARLGQGKEAMQCACLPGVQGFRLCDEPSKWPEVGNA
jgi:hypothetical protein